MYSVLHRVRLRARSLRLQVIAAAFLTALAVAAHSNKGYGQSAAATAYKVGALVIESPWARATPGGAQVAGGYLKITNKGQETDRLIGGSLSIAAAVEVHEMAMADGIMKMRRLEEGLEIKPGQTVELKPGSYHVMFTGLREGLKEGQRVKGTLVFQRAGTVEVEYRVAAIGAKSGGHMRH
jgi:periplasmic copper chaperone A